MIGLEAAATAAGKAVAQRAGREWLAARSAKADRNKDLAELIQYSFPDRFARRDLERQLAAIADSVEKRLAPLIEQEYGGLGENDRASVLLDVVTTLHHADLSDGALFAADADPVKLSKHIQGRMPAPDAQRGSAEAQLYRVVLDECCECLVRIVLGLPQFTPRAAAETLSRLSDLGNQVAAMLERLPTRTLDAPFGTDDDNEFERRYLEHIGHTFDGIELLGVRVDNYRPRATLSVAYISLSVTAEDRARPDHEPLKVATLTGAPDPENEPSTMRAEAMLARSPRVLLRGQAGSGKSTLLGWIVVTAARGAFSGRLSDWNGRVPFLIKLRSCADRPLPQPADFVTGPLAGIMPGGWVHRILDAGRGILLVDGVDEVPYGRRDTVRQWLRGLLDVYPRLRAVVTSRPAAADTRWLSSEGFRPMMLEPMTPDSLREIVQQWHAAVRHAGNLPCLPEEIPVYEGTLLARLESSPHLRALAATPLLAVMLCALNLDRVTRLPRDRMGLYRAVLDMLLERRDMERGIASHPDIGLEREQKERLLQELAWRLTIFGRAEMSAITACRRIEARAEGMPRVSAGGEEILEHLLQRSGVIREPVPGRIDFVHRTIQEYLAAKQAADDADSETLTEKAHLDQWRDTIVMAAGHANAPTRRKLLAGLIDRADNEARYAHRLRMLVAACLETVSDVPNETRSGVERSVTKLIPPRNAAEARRLAAAGEEILRRLPQSLDGLSDAQAAATVQTAWLINGSRAVEVLANYAGDPRFEVQRELIKGWEYFEPHTYADKVLANAPLIDGHLVIGNPALLPAVGRLQYLNNLDVRLYNNGSLEQLAGVPALKSLSIGNVRSSTLRLLEEHIGLKELWLTVNDAIEDVTPIMSLPSLHDLTLFPTHLDRDLSFIAHLPPLTTLGLDGISDISDFSSLLEQPDIQHIYLHSCSRLTDTSPLASLQNLRTIYLSSARLSRKSFEDLIATCINIDTLTIFSDRKFVHLDKLANLPLKVLQLDESAHVPDLEPISSLDRLETLALWAAPVSDLSPLTELRRLQILGLYGLNAAINLSPLTNLRNLHRLRLRSSYELDLSPLSAMHGLTIELDEGQSTKGAEQLQRSTKIEWRTRD